jgi:hypothetical protein
MKKISIALFAILIAASSFASTNPGPNDAVLKVFTATFPHAEGVEWFENSDHFLVNFKEGGILTKITYDKDGNFMNSIRYYESKNLPINILTAVKKKYSDKKIIGVTELTSQDGLSYHIKLEDDKMLYTVKASPEANLDVVEKFKKAN